MLKCLFCNISLISKICINDVSVSTNFSRYIFHIFKTVKEYSFSVKQSKIFNTSNKRIFRIFIVLSYEKPLIKRFNLNWNCNFVLYLRKIQQWQAFYRLMPICMVKRTWTTWNLINNGMYQRNLVHALSSTDSKNPRRICYPLFFNEQLLQITL